MSAYTYFPFPILYWELCAIETSVTNMHLQRSLHRTRALSVLHCLHLLPTHLRQDYPRICEVGGLRESVIGASILCMAHALRGQLGGSVFVSKVYPADLHGATTRNAHSRSFL